VPRLSQTSPKRFRFDSPLTEKPQGHSLGHSAALKTFERNYRSCKNNDFQKPTSPALLVNPFYQFWPNRFVPLTYLLSAKSKQPRKMRTNKPHPYHRWHLNLWNRLFSPIAASTAKVMKEFYNHVKRGASFATWVAEYDFKKRFDAFAKPFFEKRAREFIQQGIRKP
jgi:hypothetical protein